MFSLGVVLYEMLTGTPPFVAPSSSETLAAILRDRARPLRELVPGVAPGLEAIVDRCRAKAPDERYDNAGALVAALASLRAGSPRRHRYRALALSVTAVVLAGGVAAAVLTRDRRESAPASTARTITDWPVPKTTSREAGAAYAAGLQALRDGSFTAALRHFATATQLDPHFAAALVRRVWLDTGQGEPMRQALNAAREQRHLLDDRDQRLLALLQDSFQGSAAAVEADAVALAAQRPDDAEAQLWAGVALQGIDTTRSDAALTRALAVDPHLAAVEAIRASWREAAGDLDGTLAAAARCLAITPSAATCLRRRLDVDALRGDCAAFADDTRELLLREPESDVNYENRITALAAADAPADALKELARKAEALVGDPAAARALAAANAARVALYEGNFDTAEAKFLELEQLTRDAGDERAHFSSVYRMGLYEEEGDRDKAIAAANDYLRRRPAWIYDGQGFPRAYALAIQRRYHIVSADEARATRARWIAEDRQLGLTDPSILWLFYYAWPAATEEEAREALAALPHYEPLHLEQLGFAHGAAAGRTFLMAGATARAWPVLDRVRGWCGATIDTSADTTTIGWQLVIVQLHLYAGLVLEQRGDTASACAEYARVLARWGRATPKSVTAERAREHARALRCAGVTEPSPRFGSAHP